MAKKVCLISLILLLSKTFANEQDSIIRPSNKFFQLIDISNHDGETFSMSADVKIESFDTFSSARLFIAIYNSKQWLVYIDEMLDRPIKSSNWAKYTVVGKIPKNSNKMAIGGIFEHRGKFYFDNFALKLQNEISYQEVLIPNASFEDSTSLRIWKIWNPKIKGYSDSIITDTTENHGSVLCIDGSKHCSYGHNPEAGHFVNKEGVSLYYEIYGSGFPLILLHGNSQSIANFQNQIEVLSKYYKVIAIDTRGHGRSGYDSTTLSYELFASDVAFIINSLELDSINLLGWSDGGNTALILGIGENVKIHKMAIMGANLYNKSSSVKWYVNPLLIKIPQKNLEKNGKINSIEYRILQLLLDEPNINPKELINIKAEVLVMSGSNDLIKRKHTEMIARKIPNAQLKIFEGGTHFEPEQNPTRFNTTVLRFFSEDTIR